MINTIIDYLFSSPDLDVCVHQSWLGGLIAGLAAVTGSVISSVSNKKNSKSSQNSAQEWNSAEAQAQREWLEQQSQVAMQYNSQEAAVQREWEEHMSSTAYQRQVKDMQAAGVNPALMYGGVSSSASTPSASAASTSIPSGAAASMAAAPVFETSGILKAIMSTVSEAIRLEPEIRKTEGESARLEAETQRILKENGWIDKLHGAELEKAQAEINTLVKSLDEMRSRINNLDQDTALKEAGLRWVDKIQQATYDKLKSEKDYVDAQKVYQETVATELGLSQIQLNKAQTALASKEGEKILVEIDHIITQNRLTAYQGDIAEMEREYFRETKDTTIRLLTNEANLTYQQAENYFTNMVLHAALGIVTPVVAGLAFRGGATQGKSGSKGWFSSAAR